MKASELKEGFVIKFGDAEWRIKATIATGEEMVCNCESNRGDFSTQRFLLNQEIEVLSNGNISMKDLHALAEQAYEDIGILCTVIKLAEHAPDSDVAGILISTSYTLAADTFLRLNREIKSIRAALKA